MDFSPYNQTKYIPLPAQNIPGESSYASGSDRRPHSPASTCGNSLHFHKKPVPPLSAPGIRRQTPDGSLHFPADNNHTLTSHGNILPVLGNILQCILKEWRSGRFFYAGYYHILSLHRNHSACHTVQMPNHIPVPAHPSYA